MNQFSKGDRVFHRQLRMVGTYQGRHNWGTTSPETSSYVLFDGDAEYPDGRMVTTAQLEPVATELNIGLVDHIAATIRRVDGGHTTGAGDLAEAIVMELGSRVPGAICYARRSYEYVASGARPTITVGEIRKALAGMPDDRPVTILAPDAGNWLNIDGFQDNYDPGGDGEPSAMFTTRDDYDSRQW